MAKKRNYIINADTSGTISGSAAKELGEGVMAMLRQMVNQDGTFKDAKLQKEFEAFCLESGY